VIDPRGDLAALAQAAPSAEHDRATRRFAAACRDGDVWALRDLLVSDVVVTTDHGGNVRTPAAPIRGPADVVGYLASLSGGSPAHLTVEQVNGRSGIVLRRAGETVAVMVLGVTEAKVVAVWIVLNPDKLRRWQDA
jgi:RNA polymerase sigma-70 factor (ECF subfamily)